MQQTVSHRAWVDFIDVGPAGAAVHHRGPAAICGNLATSRGFRSPTGGTINPSATRSWTSASTPPACRRIYEATVLFSNDPDEPIVRCGDIEV